MRLSSLSTSSLSRLSPLFISLRHQIPLPHHLLSLSLANTPSSSFPSLTRLFNSRERWGGVSICDSIVHIKGAQLPLSPFIPLQALIAYILPYPFGNQTHTTVLLPYRSLTHYQTCSTFICMERTSWTLLPRGKFCVSLYIFSFFVPIFHLIPNCLLNLNLSSIPCRTVRFSGKVGAKRMRHEYSNPLRT